MNPYENTAEEIRRQSEGPKRLAKTGIGIGTAFGAASFAPLLARAAPFLSSYINEDMAIKGLSKISPRFGNFINNALGAGKTFDEVKDFIGSQVQESEKPSSDLSSNPVERNSPTLHQFLVSEIGKGRKPMEALAVAKVQGHGKDIESVSKKIGKNLFDVIDQLYGGGQEQGKAALQPEQQQIQPGQPHPNSARGKQLAMEQQQPGQQALMAILQKIQQSRGG